MGTENTEFPRKRDPLQGALDAVNRVAGPAAGVVKHPGRALNLILSTGRVDAIPLERATRRFSVLTPPPVEIGIETPLGDDLRTLPGVVS